MGIYNCEQTLADSLLSIKNQTYQNWELILCDDGSSDRTFEMASNYAGKDRRITFIQNTENVGLAKSLNHCLKYCTGEYILRHDGDDIMIPNRIEKQVEYMNSHHCDACGSGAYLFDQGGVWGTRQPGAKPGKEIMIISVPFIHPTVMMKHEKLVKVGGYSDNHITKQRLEDYDLWLKFYEKGYELHNIQEPLIYFREDKNSYKRKSKRFRIAETKARLEACKRLNISYFKRILALKPLLIMVIPTNSLRKYHLKQARQMNVQINQKA